MAEKEAQTSEEQQFAIKKVYLKDAS